VFLRNLLRIEINTLYPVNVQEGMFVITVLSQRGGGSLSCPEKNGRFPSPTRCDVYVQCEDGVPQEIVCPDGLLFNAKARYFAYPCQYPKDVDCEGRPGLSQYFVFSYMQT